MNACTDENVSQLTTALTTIYPQHGQGSHHNYQDRRQLLDVDLSGMPCGPKAAAATKGYFANARNRRGRQLGRVLATHYGEIVTDQIFVGNTSLVTALRPLVEAAEQVLGADDVEVANELGFIGTPIEHVRPQTMEHAITGGSAVLELAGHSFYIISAER